ncbi:bifunctional diguanylate cyclase/phosphodiesterase [Novosphingobium sp. Gsoil 351]|uniref:putative bifunctional diguanylate cyclase/phosphodiesterase n=1 Tax=Novosphingobium sp. Gsoil 351 TaxID=2675225 RepID=UPI001E2B072A|nr:EAL domain-containing protein [Novosphingobium sp. Gsoil 351]
MSSGHSALTRLKQAIPRSRASRPVEVAGQTGAPLALYRNYEDAKLGWFWATDAQGLLTYVSPQIAEDLAAEVGDLIGKPFAAIFALDKDPERASQRTLPFLLGTHTSFVELAASIAGSSNGRWWALSGLPQTDDQGEFAGYHGHGRDITATLLNQRDASQLAMYDSLTGLANRHHMAGRLATTLTAYQVAKRSCALMMLDLDRFKHVNDTLGHQAGDELLKQVARRLRRVVDETCEIGRLGGDEFQIVLPDVDDRGALGELGHKIITMLTQPYSIDGSRCVIGASVGIAIAPYDGLDSEELVRNADLALYAAKGAGRGQYRFYSSDLHSVAEERRQLEEDMRDALAKGQMRLAYQPIVALGENRITGFEALLRWEHPERGSISPALFIPIAEDAGLIGALGEWALRQACLEAAAWEGTARVAVNVSPIQFAHIGLPALVSSALANSQLAPERLELEITESVFLGEGADTQAMFDALKRLGVRLALDDFGTGYSSLGYLQKAPFDKIKIDQSFVRSATEPGNRNAAIITAIVSLATALDMETTAEGIEARDTLDLMHSLGVSHGQGFIFSRAIDHDRIVEMLRAGQLELAPDGPSTHRSDRKTLFRKVGLIHEDHRYDVTMRNLSKTGAMVEGLIDIPLGTRFVVDFGEGQLAIAEVRRSNGQRQGLEFDVPLISDGADGLCTRHRVSPYMLAAAGMPLAALPPGNYPLVGLGENRAFSLPRFAQADAPGESRRVA